jgi:Putative peptidoglycan binding domain
LIDFPYRLRPSLCKRALEARQRGSALQKAQQQGDNIMGFIQTAVLTTGEPTDFYNLEHAVGRAANNHRDDVKLVQYLLSALGYKLDVDGMCGPKTQKALSQYQMLLKSQGFSVMADGRMDRTKGGSATGSISHTVYTIIWLNQHVRGTNPGAWLSLRQFVYLKPAAAVDPEANDYIEMPCASQPTQPK